MRASTNRLVIRATLLLMNREIMLRKKTGVWRKMRNGVRDSERGRRLDCFFVFFVRYCGFLGCDRLTSSSSHIKARPSSSHKARPFEFS